MKDIIDRLNKIKEHIERRAAEEQRYFQGALDGANLLANELIESDEKVQPLTEVEGDKPRRSSKK